jgi:putative nucleotidyltransferase with HDIG domain
MIDKYITQFKDFNVEIGILAGDNIIRAISIPEYTSKNLIINERFMNQFVDALADIIRLYDPGTGKHSCNVSIYAEQIAKSMGFNKDMVYHTKVASLLHDLGKLSIPENVLNKKDKLSRDDWLSIKKHPDNSMRMLETYGFPIEVCKMVSQHQERSNSSGYNGRLDSSHICTGAKIISVADAYDAMTSEKPYRKAIPKNEAIQLLKSDDGFDAKMVEKLSDIENCRNQNQAEFLSRKRFISHKFRDLYGKRVGDMIIPCDLELSIDSVELLFGYFKDRKDMLGLKVAVGEAVSNAIAHGNCGLRKASDMMYTRLSDADYNKSVHIQYDISPERVCIRTTDQGKGFDYTNIPNPTLKENLEKDHGRGIFMMRKLADRVLFNDMGNEVTIEKNLAN